MNVFGDLSIKEQNKLKKDINVFAECIHKNTSMKYGLKRKDRRRHIYVIGKTGTGKSTLLSNMAINDLKNDEEKFERDFDYKYKTTELVDVDDYKESCKLNLNGTNICKGVLVGTHQEEREVWLDLDTKTLLKGKVTIGIFTEVQIDDHVEWIPTLFGKE